MKDVFEIALSPPYPDAEIETPSWWEDDADAAKGGPGSGHFGHAGIHGHRGGSLPSGEAEEASDVDVDRVEQRLRGILAGVAHPDMAGDDWVVVAPTKVAVRAAEQAATVLERMKREGYILPGALAVHHGSTPSELSAIEGVTHWAENYNGEIQTAMELMVPSTLPTDVDLDAAVALTFGRKEPDGADAFVPRTFADVVVHEMGHVQHGQVSTTSTELNEHGFDFDRPDEIMRAANDVSWYAMSKPEEFIAEAFLLQYNGRTLPPNAKRLYAALRGPSIRRARGDR